MQFVYCFLILSLFGITGCATRGSLPDSVAEIDFNGPVGKTGWAEYQRTEFYPGVKVDKVRILARQSLSQGGFDVFRDDPSSGCVMGEHGYTTVDWNIVMGVYYQQESAGVRIRYVVEASKDIGFMGDATERDWISEVNARIRIGLEL